MRFSLKQRLRLKKRPSSDSSSSLPFSVLSSKTPLALIPLLLLPYSFNTLALSATTANTIQGTAPYLTFDSGVTKVTTTDGLLAIKLSDGSTPAPNNTTPITLPAAGQIFADIEMLVPVTAPPVSAADPTQTINLNDLIGAPYNYWGDDDRDGQGASGITATGSLSVVITDKNGTKMNRSDMPSTCGAPYKVVLTSTAGSLSTQYGGPSSSTFTAANATYLINPASGPAVCFAKPEMTYATGNYAGPDYMWDTTKGFITQSTSTTGYGRNFPTTGANGLYFDLDISGVDATTLTWNGETHGPIGVAIDPTYAITPTTVRYKITGPASTATQQAAVTPTGVTVPSLPQQFELTGTLGGTTVVKYGFVLKQWFVNRGSSTKPAISATPTTDTQTKWCNAIGYRMPTVADLTNASGTAAGAGGTIPGATPASGGNYYSRYIGKGLFSEWGLMSPYTGAGFVNSMYWTSDAAGTNQFNVYSSNGGVRSFTPAGLIYGVCTHP